jgi:hypothetical protein
MPKRDSLLRPFAVIFGIPKAAVPQSRNPVGSPGPLSARPCLSRQKDCEVCPASAKRRRGSARAATGGVAPGRGESRAERLRAHLKQLDAMPPGQRLSFLAFDESFPLGAVPEDLIAPTVPHIPEQPAEVREALLSRLDRRKARRWRAFRRLL